ncbi:hypothetical protein IWZ01DRAFT_482514 [Phyllosticta capitalensis]
MIEYRADPERYLILGPPSPCFSLSSCIASPKDDSEIEDSDFLHPRSNSTSSNGSSCAGMLPQQRSIHQHQTTRRHHNQHAKGSSVSLSASEERKNSIPDLTVAESRWVASERCWVYKLRKSVDGGVYVSHDGNEWFAEDDVVSPASRAAA